ncbi:ABC transporter ATP-binding protein [Achromobacter sp. GG226]|uniref:ABC transporter ATP-binding protein n=1 Tax=Verticiella alkaliphila TaxID=2779529 RepID=UPI001C0E845F|nr:ABC transporter ATP-binding protein [Verticiella sp. GG226]MBU4612051.1 ABC transporter ATP-binding protein [Verticiella sp. GG226]
MADAPLLRLAGVRFGYPGAPPVVDGIDWDVPSGAFHCFVGRSGCGKSTLLRLAAGLLRPHDGTITLAGHAVQGPDREAAFVFQRPTLLDWHTVRDNVLLPVTLRGRASPADQARAGELIHALGLDGLAERYPHQLSGGQQSRVAIARALLPRPALLLMDEPFAAVDTLTRESLHDVLLAACRAEGTAVLFVTHDLAEAVYLGDRVAVMRAGRLAQAQDIALPRPRTPALREHPIFQAACAQLRQAMQAAT